MIERGQREGGIDPQLAIDWVLASVLALGHAAGEEVRAGRMTSAEAIEALRTASRAWSAPNRTTDRRV